MSISSFFGAIMFKDSLITTVNQKMLQFLAKYSDLEFHEREIARKIDIASGSANRAANELYSAGAVKRRQAGKMLFYSINSLHPALPVFKKLVNILLIEPLVEGLKNSTTRIVLYGSCAEGTDISTSDMDLFIVTIDRDAVRQSIENYIWPKGFEDIQIQAIIKTPVELLEAGSSEQAFLNEVDRGVTLWESAANERRI
jgi:predicted nucleotidyltransferase